MNVVKKNAPLKSLFSKRCLTNVCVHSHNSGNSVNSKTGTEGCFGQGRKRAVLWCQRSHIRTVNRNLMSGLASLLFSSISTAAVPPPSPLSDHHRTVLPCVFGVSSPREGARCSKLSGCRQTNSAPISLTDNHHTDRLSAGKSWATSVWFGLTGEDETTLRGTQTRNQKHAEIKKKTEFTKGSFLPFCDWTIFQFYWHWS